MPSTFLGNLYHPKAKRSNAYSATCEGSESKDARLFFVISSSLYRERWYPDIVQQYPLFHALRVCCARLFSTARLFSVFSNHVPSRIDFLALILQLSDLFEDEESADQPPAVATNGQPPRAEAPAEATKAAVAEEEVVVDDKTPEGQFLKLSGGTGGVLTLDGLLG